MARTYESLMTTKAPHLVITILGAGYVGLTTAALFAQAGYKVYALEPNPERLEAIRKGKSFFYEQGLDAVIASGLDTGMLVPTDSYADSIPKSHMVFSCVGTPDNPDGSSDLSYVHAAATQTAQYIADDAIYIQKSTVPVGTGRDVMAEFKKLGKTTAYVSNPEFLRESTALYDTLY
ncbi:MAG TPA: 3-hydroxyacyl-CoA dehydrogenase NAD-binding domain-containing protein, partial [Candidatus Saccharimonadaceae bacterium]|nr:3-hydroxyacyl-CoA dehydrogenase NAD-binding domain-containing protein [Candidatus Saccharimonadaceae bacterium]